MQVPFEPEEALDVVKQVGDGEIDHGRSLHPRTVPNLSLPCTLGPHEPILDGHEALGICYACRKPAASLPHNYVVDYAELVLTTLNIAHSHMVYRSSPKSCRITAASPVILSASRHASE